MTDLSPASQTLLRAIAKYDTGGGVLFRYAGRGRYSHPNTLACFNAGTFRPLYRLGLVDDGGNDSAPVRVTEAGRKLAAELNAAAAEKKPRPKPSADGAAAQRLLLEIAKCDGVLRYDDGLRRAYRVGSGSGHRASIATWIALEKASYIRTERVSSIGGHRVSITDAGQKRLAS